MEAFRHGAGQPGDPFPERSLDLGDATSRDSDLTAFARLFQREPWLLGDAFVEFQADLIGAATLNDRREFITVLLDLDPAILRRQPPPSSQAIEFAFTYVRTPLIPLLTRIGRCPTICRTRRAWATSRV